MHIKDDGNALATAIERVVEVTDGMTKVQGAFGDGFEAKLRSAARMIHEVDAKQPGLKQFLKARGVGDNAMVVSMLIQQRWEIRKRR